eukprot:c24123_g17_i1 orf=240-395(+)
MATSRSSSSSSCTLIILKYTLFVYLHTIFSHMLDPILAMACSSTSQAALLL